MITKLVYIVAPPLTVIYKTSYISHSLALFDDYILLANHDSGFVIVVCQNIIIRTLFNLLIKEYTLNETYLLQEVFTYAGNDIKTTVFSRF